VIKDQRYVCECRVPRPLIHKGEDTGLCAACNGVYDEQLYEMRCRQHIPNFNFDTVEDYLRDKDPQYQG
jgi:hypothetical protein